MPRRVYLRPDDLRARSGHHTAYVGDSPITMPGEQPKPLHKLEFFGGVATNVDDATYRRFKDAGIATDKRPGRSDDND